MWRIVGEGGEGGRGKGNVEHSCWTLPKLEGQKPFNSIPLLSPQ